MNVSERIKELRERRGISQDTLADAIGVDRTTIVKYETGKSKPTRKLKELADYFGITTDELLGRDLEGRYYTDPETAEIADALKDGDGMLRVMFDAARTLPPDKMREAANYIQYLKARQHPEEND